MTEQERPPKIATLRHLLYMGRMVQGMNKEIGETMLCTAKIEGVRLETTYLCGICIGDQPIVPVENFYWCEKCETIVTIQYTGLTLKSHTFGLKNSNLCISNSTIFVKYWFNIAKL